MPKGYKYLSDVTGVGKLISEYRVISLIFRIKEMVEKTSSESFYGTLKITYSHPDLGDYTFTAVNEFGYLLGDEEFFRVSPKTRKLGGHDYYLVVKFRKGLNVGELYRLDKTGETVSAHLELDGIEGDKNASGTFLLKKGGDYPVGEFKIFEEGVFSASGEFEYKEIKDKLNAKVN